MKYLWVLFFMLIFILILYKRFLELLYCLFVCFLEDNFIEIFIGLGNF